MVCLWETLEENRRTDKEFLAEFMLGVVPVFECESLAHADERNEMKRANQPSLTTVHNMVSTSILQSSDMPINLTLLAMLLPCSTYDRRRFAAITIRLENPRCTALLFTSGKLVITGVKSWSVASHLHQSLFSLVIVDFCFLLDGQVRMPSSILVCGQGHWAAL